MESQGWIRPPCNQKMEFQRLVFMLLDKYANAPSICMLYHVDNSSSGLQIGGINARNNHS